MPIKAVKQFTAWSYSRLSDYEGCPLKAKLKHLDKIQEPAGDALERGSEIHKKCEAYVSGRLPELPKELVRFGAEFEDLRKLPAVQTELQLAVDVDWKPCEWFGRNAWLRVVIDCAYVEQVCEGETPRRAVIDYKTGQIRPANADQLDLYGLVTLAYHPEVKRVESALWYLDAGEIVNRVLTRGPEATRVRKAWVKRAAPMLADQTFAPTPGNACRWCFYGQAKKPVGGPGLCKF